MWHDVGLIGRHRRNAMIASLACRRPYRASFDFVLGHDSNIPCPLLGCRSAGNMRLLLLMGAEPASTLPSGCAAR